MKLAPTFFYASLLASSSLAAAATINVSNLGDTGAGTLRAAIAQANSMPGSDTIVFQSNLSGTLLLSAPLVITESLVINGPGADRVTIDANGAGRVFRIDNPNGAARSWALSGLTVTGGVARSGNDDSGGGLYYETPGFSSQRPDLDLRNMFFVDNEAGRQGGAISVSGANLTISNTTLLGNRASGGFQPSGGGLHFNRGLLRLERSTIVGNSAELVGGGIRITSPGVSAVISDSLIENNDASLRGGGMLAGTMTSLQISRSAFVGNRLTNQLEGGALYFEGTTETGAPQNFIENSTFSGNSTAHESSRGSAIAVAQGNMTVRNSTIAFNKTAPNLTPNASGGGALWVNNGGTTRVTVQSVLFQGNTHGNSSLPNDLSRLTGGSPGSTLAVDHAAFSQLPDAGVITAFGAGNLAVDAQLQALTWSQGGLTPLHPLPRTSPVIDQGSNPANLATDQRGTGFIRGWSDPRNRNGAPDIGAYEVRGDAIFVGDFEQQ